ncbi:MAG: right-handed parallel beta-helix repeat-containing protein, partial [Anaerolineales bacterium]|nr:right-handed parallel beta-helix repeat-containing protein [Anaerolineales bacterium]
MNREKTRSLAMSGGLLGALLLVCLLALLPAAPTGALAQSAPAPPPPAAAPRWPTGTVITEDVTVNTTWTLAGSPYQLAANIAVAPGVTLRLDPGVTVEADGVGLDVAGTLLAQGTMTQPVTFTGASPTPGIWDGIRIHGTAQTPNTGSMLAHTVVEYGGDHLRYNLFLEYADVSLAGGALRHSLRDGLYAVHSTAAISGTAFSQNGGYAALFEQASGDLDLHNLSASQNGHDGIALKSTTLTGAHTWEDGGVPYLLAGVVGVHHVGTAPGSTLTIEPGVVVQSEGVGFYVEGQLQAVGTAVSPILFTADTPTAGSWDGLHIQGTAQAPNTGSTLAYVTVAYGGQYKSANLHLDWAAATITHCTFRDAVSLGAFPVHGILAADSTAVIRDSHFANNHDYAVYFSALSADPVLENLTAAGNGTDGIALIHSDLAGAHRWEASGLPYYLLGQVDVLAGAELTVAPGVEVRAAGSPLDVAGTLRAIGTAARPITFTAI